jgi:hypothetical protein
MSGAVTVDDVIKVHLQVFKDCRDNLKNNLNKGSNYQSLIKKKQDIYDNNKCFHIHYNPEVHQPHPAHPTHTGHPGHPGHPGHHNNQHSQYHNSAPKSHNTQHNKPNRLYIITSDFTEDSKVKKQFIGYMNKLTENNKTTIYDKIKELLTGITDKNLLDTVYETVWDFIGKSSDPLYINVLNFFSKDMTTAYIDNYVENKIWYPPQYAFENNLLVADTESDQVMYDMYCNYVKWKKSTTNTNKAIFMLTSSQPAADLQKLLQDLYALFELAVSETKFHLVHFALEQLQLFPDKNNKTFNEIANKLRDISMEKLDSSSKFLILDILEL